MKKKYNPLTREETHILLEKGTEPPFSGKYVEHFQQGVYCCKQCDAPLYRSEDKFPTQCGWPSFDDEIPGAVKHTPDADGRRTEILCANCGGHLGHVFHGEYLTAKNTRHCVNSIAMDFLSQQAFEQKYPALKKAYFGGGCFWGVEHLMQQQDGVFSVLSGYMGGKTESPSYEQVCRGDTGHVEVVEVLYDSNKVAFKTLAKLFFEIHDPTQNDGQGPDRGTQYQSVIFYTQPSEKNESDALIQQLEKNGLKVCTRLEPADTFWPAEEYHQNYYEKNGKAPYCHQYQKRFDDE